MKTRPAFTWYGGKYYLGSKIVDLMPSHFTYVEPFGGAASVLLSKAHSPIEIYNDLDYRLFNFFRVLRDSPDELIRRLVLTPYSEAEFKISKQPISDPVEAARRFYVECRQSFSAIGKTFGRSCKDRNCRRGMAGRVSSWLSSMDENLPEIIERLRRVELSCRPALDVIRKYDSPKTLFYCDPPYLPSARTAGPVYKCDMTEDDHRALASALQRCKGKVILSGYDSPLYRKLYRRWNRVEFSAVTCAPKTRKPRTEVVWMNYKSEKARRRAA